MLLFDVCVAARRPLETIMEEEEEGPKVVAPRFVPMVEVQCRFVRQDEPETKYSLALYFSIK